MILYRFSMILNIIYTPSSPIISFIALPSWLNSALTNSTIHAITAVSYYYPP